MRDYEGICWTQDHQWEDPKKQPEAWGIRKLISVDEPGLSKKQGVIHRGSNSGYQAINLALHLLGEGGGRIILLGFDMMMHGDMRHWFGNHPQPFNHASNYADFVGHFQTINPAEYGLEIWNCSRRTALTHFPCHDLDECLEFV